jgi:ATP-dependent helicase/nuclease subunit A
MLDGLGAAATMVERDKPGSIERSFHPAETVADSADRLLNKQSSELIAQSLLDLKPLAKPPARSLLAAAAIERLEYQYPHASATSTPAVTSVTASTKSGKVAPGGKSVSAKGVVAFEPVLDLPRVVAESTLSAADLGTITHNVLQRIDLPLVTDRRSLDRELAKSVERRFLRPDELPHVDHDAILWFVNSPLGKQLCTATDVRRELSITFTQPIDDVDQQLVRGRLDAVIVEPDGLTIIDYKTDNVTDATIDQRATFYRSQIDAYRKQLERLTRRPVKAAHLVFLKPRRVVEV